MLFRPTKKRNNALFLHQDIIFICFRNESIQWWWYTCGLYDRENPSIWGSSQLIEREAQMRIDSIELRIVNFLSLKHKKTKLISFSWLWSRRWLKVFWFGCRTEINCVSYWVTRTGKPLFEMCCFNMGITQIALETSENDLFLTLGSGLPVPKTKI